MDAFNYCQYFRFAVRLQKRCQIQPRHFNVIYCISGNFQTQRNANLLLFPKIASTDSNVVVRWCYLTITLLLFSGNRMLSWSNPTQTFQSYILHIRYFQTFHTPRNTKISVFEMCLRIVLITPMNLMHLKALNIWKLKNSSFFENYLKLSYLYFTLCLYIGYSS